MFTVSQPPDAKFKFVRRAGDKVVRRGG